VLCFAKFAQWEVQLTVLYILYAYTRCVTLSNNCTVAPCVAYQTVIPTGNTYTIFFPGWNFVWQATHGATVQLSKSVTHRVYAYNMYKTVRWTSHTGSKSIRLL